MLGYLSDTVYITGVYPQTDELQPTTEMTGLSLTLTQE